MDSQGRNKSDLGNAKKLRNVEKNAVTGIKTSDLPVGNDGVTEEPTLQEQGNRRS
ncbi:MAG TPA: hypothetical protein VMB47_17175 [Candidatus Aquilonibacter sp.]|nr:hypothetical protein [Candidatus Aquilonibacter sp.]